MLAIHCGHNGILNGKEFEYLQRVIEAMEKEPGKSNPMNPMSPMNQMNPIKELNESKELNDSLGSYPLKKSMKNRTRREEAYEPFSPIEMKSMSKDESDYDFDNDQDMMNSHSEAEAESDY